MWNKEPIGVKNHYRQLSSQLENELTEIRRENLVYIDNNESNYKKRRRTTKTTQNQISISEGIVSINYNKKRRRTTKTTQNQISISEGIVSINYNGGDVSDESDESDNNVNISDNNNINGDNFNNFDNLNFNDVNIPEPYYIPDQSNSPVQPNENSRCFILVNNDNNTYCIYYI
ncbi:3725_t:CDS:1 [Entrophospora sp. SA101]|nr:3725_t:CDS:1 [Entrophospora sp. SA101]